MKKRVPFYDLAGKGGSVRLFNKETYSIKGFFAVEENTGTLKKIPDIYYQIRTVKNCHGRVVAKRKKPQDELLAI